ncbi:MAG TPA: efflux RND transporter periplasmic adaptor subunit [Thermoanaerobaculia bacterium]|nr:efflux RND transporter periplasmic adaptor subunit [Thermoanaerobaculia bacterium]
MPDSRLKPFSRAGSVLAVVAITFSLFSCRREQLAVGELHGLPVRTEEVKRAPFAATLTLIGTVRPSQTIPLMAPRGGILSYPGRFAGGLRTGERVRHGEALAFIQNEEARLALAQGRLRVESAGAEEQRLTKSVQLGISSKIELDESRIRARSARESLASLERESARLAIVASREGQLVVSQVYPPGSEVAAGTTLAELAVGGMPHVEGSAAASDRPRLAPGQRVRFSIDGSADPRGEGTVREVASVVDRAGTIRVTAVVTDATNLPAPGEGVEMQVELSRRPDALTVPEEALVITSAGSAAVYVLEPAANMEGAHEVRRVPVQVMGRAGGRAAVSGVEEHDRIVVSGVEGLADKAMVVEVKPGA